MYKNICEYGCGSEAHFQFGNGKWCCESYYGRCSEMRKKNSVAQKGKHFSDETRRKISGSLKGKTLSKETRKKISESKKGKFCGENNSFYGKTHSVETRQKISNAQKGKNHPMYGKTHSEEARQKISESLKGKTHSKETRQKLRLSIEKIKEKYPFFSKIEELRYNPDKPEENEIQARCKNHVCLNSKERGGWFVLTKQQISHRIHALENGNGGYYFYCCQECKDVCPLFNLRSDPYQNTEKPYTDSEYRTWRKEVLRRQFENVGYNECEICGAVKDLHVHHEKPQKTHPHLSLDPDNGIIFCQSCHYGYGHGDEVCTTGALANIICIN